MHFGALIMPDKNFTEFKQQLSSWLRHVKTAKALKRCIQDVLVDFGLTHFDVSYVDSKYNMKTVMSNLPHSLIDSYEYDHLNQSDIVMAYATSDERYIEFYQAYEYFITNPFNSTEVKRTKAMYRLMIDYAFYNAYTIYVNVNWLKEANEKIMFTVYAEDVNCQQFMRTIKPVRPCLTLTADMVCHKLVNDFDDFRTKEITADLTKNQIAILDAIGNYSMTQQQVADYVGLTDATVKTYCKYIKEKLGKTTLSGCVVEAIRRGVIDVHDKPDDLEFMH